MSDTPREQQPGGIFIPFDKLLASMDEKLDKITTELREISKGKLDVATFESHRAAYEERHERLVVRLNELDRSLDNRPQLITEFRELQGKVDSLETDKAGRDAIRAQNRYYLAGGGAVGLLVIANLVLTLLRLVGHT